MAAHSLPSLWGVTRGDREFAGWRWVCASVLRCQIWPLTSGQQLCSSWVRSPASLSLSPPSQLRVAPFMPQAAPSPNVRQAIWSCRSPLADLSSLVVAPLMTLSTGGNDCWGGHPGSGHLLLHRQAPRTSRVTHATMSSRQPASGVAHGDCAPERDGRSSTHTSRCEVPPTWRFLFRKEGLGRRTWAERLVVRLGLRVSFESSLLFSSLPQAGNVLRVGFVVHPSLCLPCSCPAHTLRRCGALLAYPSHNNGGSLPSFWLPSVLQLVRGSW